MVNSIDDPARDPVVDAIFDTPREHSVVENTILILSLANLSRSRFRGVAHLRNPVQTLSRRYVGDANQAQGCASAGKSMPHPADYPHAEFLSIRHVAAGASFSWVMRPLTPPTKSDERAISDKVCAVQLAGTRKVPRKVDPLVPELGM